MTKSTRRTDFDPKDVSVTRLLNAAERYLAREDYGAALYYGRLAHSKAGLECRLADRGHNIGSTRYTVTCETRFDRAAHCVDVAMEVFNKLQKAKWDKERLPQCLRHSMTPFVSGCTDSARYESLELRFGSTWFHVYHEPMAYM